MFLLLSSLYNLYKQISIVFFIFFLLCISAVPTYKNTPKRRVLAIALAAPLKVDNSDIHFTISPKNTTRNIISTQVMLTCRLLVIQRHVVNKLLSEQTYMHMYMYM